MVEVQPTAFGWVKHGPFSHQGNTCTKAKISHCTLP